MTKLYLTFLLIVLVILGIYFIFPGLRPPILYKLPVGPQIGVNPPPIEEEQKRATVSAQFRCKSNDDCIIDSAICQSISKSSSNSAPNQKCQGQVVCMYGACALQK